MKFNVPIMVSVLAICFFLFPSSVLSATDIEKKISACATIEKDDERLKCYDNLSSSQTEQPEEQTEPTEAWSINRSESKLDGNQTVTYMTKSLGEVPNSIGVPEKATLILRCKDNATDAYLAWPGNLGTFDDVAVTFKIDDGKIIKERWYPSSGLASAAFAKKPIDFIKKLSEGKQIIFKVSPYNHTAQEAEFAISGADEAMKEISAACSWNKGAKKK